MKNKGRTGRPSCKVWIEIKGTPILGKGGAEILEQIEKTESISKTAKRLGMSYRYAWSYLRKIQRNLEVPVVKTFRGGRAGGGGARLTEEGQNLLNEYNRLERFLSEVLSSVEFAEVMDLKASAGNRLKGKVTSVEKDGVTARVKLEVTAPVTVTALISKEAVEDLKIKVGDKVEAIVKATEVMIGKE